MSGPSLVCTTLKETQSNYGNRRNALNLGIPLIPLIRKIMRLAAAGSSAVCDRIRARLQACRVSLSNDPPSGAELGFLACVNFRGLSSSRFLPWRHG
jgi:hypothetical protein